ncbi:MAG: hypothetical protein AAFP19_26110 [Bacteroidota bacterium]
MNLYLVGILFLFSLNANTLNPSVEGPLSYTNEATELACDERPNGIIVMEDVIARVNSDQPSLSITRFVVYNNLTSQVVYDANGCGLAECTYDLGDLDSGNYYAEVTQGNGTTFGSYITVP